PMLLEPLRDARAFCWMLAIRTGHFTAQARRRQHLAGITETTGIDRVAHLLHHVEIVLREHARHVIALVGTNAVFTGDRSTGFDAIGQDLPRHFFGQRGLSWYALVVADQRVQVAITGVEHVAD